MQANKGRRKTSTGSYLLKNELLKLWHLSDSFDWMSPLPFPHRRGVILATMLMLGAFLWPTPSPETNPTTPVDIATLTGQNQPQSITPVALSEPELHHTTETPPVESTTTPSQQDIPVEATPEPQSERHPPVEQTVQADNGQWKAFTIQKGHTLTQLFRENNYTVSDAFLMARVEGQGRPVNELRIGQKVKVRVTNDGQVTALEIELTPNRSALFTRQSNGSFKRER